MQTRKFILTVKAARMTRDLRSYGRMSPVALARLGSLAAQTSPSKQADDCMLYVDIYDSVIEQKKFISSAEFDMSIAHSQPKFKEWITLRYKGKRVGDLLLEGGFSSDSSSQRGAISAHQFAIQQPLAPHPGAAYMMPQQFIAPPKVQMQTELEMGNMKSDQVYGAYPAVPVYQPPSSASRIPVGYQVSAPPSVLTKGQAYPGPGATYQLPSAGSKLIYPSSSSSSHKYTKLQEAEYN